MKRFHWAILLSLVILLPQVSPAAPGDEHWDSQFGAPGTTNAVFALALKDGRLYAGGDNSAGPNTNATLQVWDGLQWSEFATFSGSTFPPINDMAFVGDTLYVAGLFDHVNGTPIAALARWDGNSWTGLGLSGVVDSVAADNGKLYATGSFTNADADGVIMTNIGCWDGSSWHALGGGLGIPGSTGPQVVIANNGLVYAGGLFNNSGSLQLTNIAVWDGTNWASVGGGVGVPNASIIYCLTSDGSDLYAGGYFTQAGSMPVVNVARWDGNSWSAMGTGLSGTGGVIESLGLFNGHVCAAGTFTTAGSLGVNHFAVWTGSTWTNADVGLSSTGYRVLGNGTNIYVGGSFLRAGDKLVNGIATWDGASWNGLGTPGRMNGVYAIAGALAGDGTNLYAGGATSLFQYTSDTNFNMIARFDGTRWHPLGSGITGPSAITGPIGTSIQTLALSNNVLYAGGYFNNAGGVSVQNIAKWDGTNWSALGNPGGAVASIMVRTDGVYAVGAPFYNTSNFGSPFCLRWNGSSWNSVLNFDPNDTFVGFHISDPNFGMAAIASIGTNIFIGGHFYITWHNPDLTMGTNCNNIMRFDGTYGRIMGT